MAKKKVTAPAVVAPEATVEVGQPPVGTGHAPEVTEKTSSGKTKADVVDQSGNVIRTYTLAEHGDNFADLAKQYADQVSSVVRLL